MHLIQLVSDASDLAIHIYSITRIDLTGIYVVKIHLIHSLQCKGVA
jgi:hypothetical protein